MAKGGHAARGRAENKTATKELSERPGRPAETTTAQKGKRKEAPAWPKKSRPTTGAFRENKKNSERRPPELDPRQEAEESLIEGRNAVSAALEAERPLNKAWILQKEEGKNYDGRLAQIERELRRQAVPLHYANRKALDRLSPTGYHQGVILQAAAHAYADARSLVEEWLESGREPFLLILDGIQDGRNLGSILRVSDAAGVDLVVLPERRSVALDSYVSRAAAGAAEYVPVAREVNLSQFVLWLKERKFWVYGSAADTDTEIYDADFRGALAIVVGSEGKGMSEKLQTHCDRMISIPMRGKINSLNAAVACGVLCMEASRQRR